MKCQRFVTYYQSTILLTVVVLSVTIHPTCLATDSSLAGVQLNACCPTPFSFSNGECKSNSSLGSNDSPLPLSSDPNVSNLLQSVITQQEGFNSSEFGSLQFRFTTDLPECVKEKRRVKLGRLATSNGTSSDQDRSVDVLHGNGTDHKLNDSSTNRREQVGGIRPNGYLMFEQHFYPPTEYCINGFNEAEENIEFVICDNTCGSSTPTKDSSASSSSVSVSASCLPKCCQPDQLLYSTDLEFKCVSVHSNFSWNPILRNEQNPHEPVSHEEQNGSRLPLPRFIHTHPNSWCKTDGFFMYQRDFPMNPKVEFHILKNGGVYYLNEADHVWENLPVGSYCIDGIYDEDLFNQSASGGALEDNNVIYYCPPESSEEFADVEESDKNQQISILYYVVLIISSTFLLLTIIIHAISLDKQNIHGRTLLCCFVSLLCLYIFLALLHATRLYLDKDPKSTFCWAIGVGLHFFFLSTFSWLSVVNFDLWFTFRTLRTLISPKSHRFKRFVIYSVFAVGTPVIILAVALTIDSVYRNSASHQTGTPILPAYGQDGCFFSSHEAAFVYLYGPIGVLLLMNLLLFVLTIAAMYKLKKTSSIATSTSNSYANQPRQSFHLFLKLFVLMGVSWIFEVISWAAHPKTIPWYWVIFDLINICQGIFIFFIFTCKRSTIRILEQKYPRFKGLADACRAHFASFSCAKSCPSGSSSANNTTIQEMTSRKLSETVDTDIEPA